MFSHVFKYKFKILLKKKSMIFWTLFFPIILSTLFNFAFSNLDNQEKFEAINIAVVNDEKFNNNLAFKNVIAKLSDSDDDQIFITKYTSLDDAKELLNSNEIIGYITVEDEINLIVKNNGLNQTITKTVIDSYYQITNVAKNIAEYDYNVLKEGILNELNHNYFIDTNDSKMNATVVYFYTLIGMVCAYSSFFGVNAISETEANLSKRGARTNIAPTHKLKILMASLLVSFIIQYLELLILFGYMVFILGIDFGNQIGYILLLTLIGVMAGISMGILIGVSNKKSENVKTTILVIISMIFSFLAGMMVLDIKYLIAKNIPILTLINPVNMITDALYSLYYYDTLNRYFYNVFLLGIFSIVMFSISYIIIRRKKYDSI